MESEIWGLQSRISPYPSFPPPSQHPLSSVPHLQDAGTAGYPSHFPNSCLLTLSPSCAFARTVDFLYKTDEEEKKYFALFLLRFIMLRVCACVSPAKSKSGETIRGEPGLFNEPRGNAKCMCFHLQSGEAWCTNKEGGGKSQLFMLLPKQVPWLLLGILTHLFVF